MNTGVIFEISSLADIRKSLIVSVATRKYIVYTIGQMLLVVMGILIDLQINNWNKAQKYREEEAFYLEELRSDFETNRMTMMEKEEFFHYTLDQVSVTLFCMYKTIPGTERSLTR
jgi:hypothetical protein